MAEKKLIYSGKSKDVFEITEGSHAGKYLLCLKTEQQDIWKTENLFSTRATIR
jgi:hypothetical protein